MATNVPSIIGSGAQLPAHLQQYTGQENAAAGLVTSFLSLPAISIKGKQFRFVKDGVETPMPIGAPLNVVILGFDPETGLAKAYYKDAYAPGSAEAPDCFSSTGITPDSFVTAPICRSCTECPFNAFGSGVDASGNASKGKRCADHKNLFVVAADKLDGDIAVLRVPGTSLKALSALGSELAKHGVPTQVLATELSFTNDEHPQLNFRPAQWLSEADAARMVTRGASDELSTMKPSNNRGAVAPVSDTIALPAGPAPSSLPPPPPGVAAASPPPEPVKTMTEKAGATPYQSFVDQGWTDEQLIEQCYMEIS